MINPETVSEAFIKWMEDNGYGTFDVDIFLNQIPDVDENDEPINNAYWIITSGGDVTQKNITAESVQQFTVDVFYRNKSGRLVEKTLFELSRKVNSRDCLMLNGFEVHDIEASLPEDNDRDAENRRQGSFSVDMQIYVSYVS